MVFRTRTCHYTYLHSHSICSQCSIKRNSFQVQVAEAHLHGDHDPHALTPEMRKLKGNTSYGTLITNNEKHHDIVYVDKSEIGQQITSPHFYNTTELPDSYYEAERAKPSINLNISSCWCLYDELRQASFARILL